MFLVLRQCHHAVQVLPRLNLDLDHPAFAVRIFADDTRVVNDGLVDVLDFAVDGGVEIANRLDRFDLAEAFAGEDVVADIGQLDVDDVGELFDGELGDADGADVAFEAGPFMRLRIAQILGVHRGLQGSYGTDYLPWAYSLLGAFVKRKRHDARVLIFVTNAHRHRRA